jgi:hypothetical protein
VYSKFVFPA